MVKHLTWKSCPDALAVAIDVRRSRAVLALDSDSVHTFYECLHMEYARLLRMHVHQRMSYDIQGDGMFMVLSNVQPEVVCKHILQMASVFRHELSDYISGCGVALVAAIARGNISIAVSQPTSCLEPVPLFVGKPIHDVSDVVVMAPGWSLCIADNVEDCDVTTKSDEVVQSRSGLSFTVHDHALLGEQLHRPVGATGA